MPELPIDTDDETNPDAAEVFQREDEPGHPAVLVEHNGPLGVIDLPARVGVMVSYQLGVLTQPLLGADPRRKSALIIAENDAIFVGTTAARVTDGSCSKWPAGVPLPVTHIDALYARAAVAGTLISIISEQWTR